MDKTHDIQTLLRIYAEGGATEEQRVIVREYIMDDAGRFDQLLEAMRDKAMRELELDTDSDFLPGHLERCAPSAFAMSSAFRGHRRNVSAFVADTGRRRSAFEILRERLLDESDDSDLSSF